MDPFILQPGRTIDRCCVKGCRSRVIPAKRKKQGRFCRRCKELRYKATHPYAYSLNKLRNNAKRRGIHFDLTLEEWIMFCDLTGLVGAHGRGAEDLSVDRIESRKGYTLDNIQAMSVGDNARKSNAERLGWRHKGVLFLERVANAINHPKSVAA